MGRSIDHFIWGYQSHYRTHLIVAAQHVLKLLDEGLQPEAFIVGILQENRNDRYPACVDPEKEYWIESEAFDGVAQLAASIRETFAERQVRHSDRLMQQRADAALHRRATREAILQIVNSHPKKPPDRTFFVSAPVLVDGFLVSEVLSVITAALDSYHRLQSDEVMIHEYWNMPVVRSLIDAAIIELLEEASDGLLRPDPGLNNMYREAEETVRSAGRRLVRNSAFRTNHHALDADYFFYDACDKISALTYEQNETLGRFLLAPRDNSDLRSTVKFKADISLQNHRRIRKLLEMTSNGGALHTDSEHIFGLVDYDSPTSPNENVFEVVFLGHHHWQLHHQGKILMGVRLGEPYLLKPVGYERKLRQDLPRLFAGINTAEIELLLSLVKQVARERRGTLLIVSVDAASESVRLRNQATPTEPTLLTSELLAHLTCIDGAVLIDVKGYCHALGVILDGEATPEGDPARGARFNSAIRYVHSSTARAIPTLAVVVSEDGGVDLVPK